jgi:hypothetical protein
MPVFRFAQLGAELTDTPESTSALQLVPSNTVAVSVPVALVAAHTMLPLPSGAQLASEVTASPKSVQPDHLLLNSFAMSVLV